GAGHGVEVVARDGDAEGGGQVGRGVRPIHRPRVLDLEHEEVACLLPGLLVGEIAEQDDRVGDAVDLRVVRGQTGNQTGARGTAAVGQGQEHAHRLVGVREDV